MESVKRRLKPHGHFIQDRKTEIVVGLLLFFVGAILMYDAFDSRGKPMPWPASLIAPW